MQTSFLGGVGRWPTMSAALTNGLEGPTQPVVACLESSPMTAHFSPCLAQTLGPYPAPLIASASSLLARQHLG